MEKLTDQSDLATQREDEFRAAALAEHARSMLAPKHFDGKHCVDEECGEPIAEGRLALGLFRCIHCAERLELRGRRFKT